MEIFEIFYHFIIGFQDEITYLSWAILFFGTTQNLIYLIQLFIAALDLAPAKLRNQEDYIWWMVTPDAAMPVSMIIPAYNEEKVIINTVSSMLAMHYPIFEVIVVNDGSSDKTLKILIESFDLSPTERFYENKLEHKNIRCLYTSKNHPNLIVIDKENGGRSDALNAGIDVSRHPLFCTVDADSMLDAFSLLKIVQPFIADPERVVATGGTVRILNGCKVENGVVKEVKISKKILPLLQTVEYIRAFLVGRVAWSHIRILTIISGAFAVFKRDITIQVGAFNTKTIGEDFEVIMRIHEYCLRTKRKYEMHFIPQPVCWTEAPEDLRSLKNQRIRWHQGCLEVFFRYLKMFMNPRYGRIGMIAYPIMFGIDVLGPLVELLGYVLLPTFYIMGALDTSLILLFILIFIILGIFISISSLILEEISLKRFNSAKDLLTLGTVAIIENFGYRQLNTIWRIIGWWRFLTKKQSWGKIRRVGV